MGRKVSMMYTLEVVSEATFGGIARNKLPMIFWALINPGIKLHQKLHEYRV